MDKLVTVWWKERANLGMFEVETQILLSLTKFDLRVCSKLACDFVERNPSHRAALNAYYREFLKMTQKNYILVAG